MSPSLSARRVRAFTIIEIIVILIIIALMIAIIVPHFFVAHRRAEAERVKQDLNALNLAVEHYALDTGKVAGMHPAYADLRKYLDPKSDVYRLEGKDALGEAYGPFTVGTPSTVPVKTYESLSSILPQDFWSPYR